MAISLWDGKETQNRIFHTEGVEKRATVMKKVICTRHQIFTEMAKNVTNDITWESKTTIILSKIQMHIFDRTFPRTDI